MIFQKRCLDYLRSLDMTLRFSFVILRSEASEDLSTDMTMLRLPETADVFFQLLVFFNRKRPSEEPLADVVNGLS